ncbi:hypothetical protein NUACC21_40860 [Scytonema sp. NUACC21]
MVIDLTGYDSASSQLYRMNSRTVKTVKTVKQIFETDKTVTALATVEAIAGKITGSYRSQV